MMVRSNMMKEKIVLHLSIFLCWIAPFPASAYESDLPLAMQSSMSPPTLKAVSWVLMNPETGIMIAAENPDKEMVRICSIRCPHMNQITMEETLASLREMQYVIDVPEEIRIRAYRAVKRMIEIGPSGRQD